MPTRSKDFKIIFSQEALSLAWKRYIRYPPRSAKDSFGVKAFSTNLDRNLNNLSKMLIDGNFRPARPPKFFMPKSSGMQRTITILPVIDSLVFQSITNHISTLCYSRLVENNDFVFGSVLHEEVRLGLKVLKKPDAEYYFFKPWQVLYKEFADSVNKVVRENKVEYKFETDITGFYDSIPHFNLLDTISCMTGLSGDVLDLLAEALNIWSGTRERATPGVGIPQATGASHFLANLFLHDLDNVVRLRGLPYYRYMDDIRIYGYKRHDLQRVLIIIDAHLKQHALSLNAKKTFIEKIDSEVEEDLAINFQYNPNLISAYAMRESKDFLSFVDQEGAGYADKERKMSSKVQKEIVSICYRDIKEVKRLLKKVVSPKLQEKINFDDRSVQREFMNSAYRFRLAVEILRESGRKPRLLKGKILKGWLLLAERYFWFINQFCWVLALYKEEKSVKKGLMKLIKQYEEYEWVQSELYSCLAMSQSFTPHELHECLHGLSQQDSWYSKRSIYKLLLIHSKDKQFDRSILACLGQEKDKTLQREIFALAGMRKDQRITQKELMEAFGLT